MRPRWLDDDFTPPVRLSPYDERGVVVRGDRVRDGDGVWWLWDGEKFVSAPGIAPKVKGLRVFLGWYEPDKKAKPEVVLVEAYGRYQDKFNQAKPQVALVNPAWAEPLAKAAAVLNLALEVAPYIPARTIYLGEHERDDER